MFFLNSGLLFIACHRHPHRKPLISSCTGLQPSPSLSKVTGTATRAYCTLIIVTHFQSITCFKLLSIQRKMLKLIGVKVKNT